MLRAQISAAILATLAAERGLFLRRRSAARSHRARLSRELQFLQIKISKKEKDNTGDNETTQQTMKQNIEIMTQFLKNLTAIHDDSGRARRLGQTFASCELLVEKEFIKFYLAVPHNFSENIEKMVYGFYPGAVVERVDQPKLLTKSHAIAGADITLKKDSVFPIDTFEDFEADPMDSIFGSFSKSDASEKMCLQLLVAPDDDSLLKKLRKTAEKIKKGEFGKSRFREIRDSISKSADKKEKDADDEKKHDYSDQQISAIDKKAEHEMFAVQIRALVISPHETRARNLLDDLLRTFNQFSAAGLNSFRAKPAKNLKNFAKKFVAREFSVDAGIFSRRKKLKNSQILNIKELATIFHFPNFRFNKSPRLIRQKYKVVRAPDNLPTEGMLLGHNTAGGIKKEVRMKFKDRFRHIYIIGQTGTGKTTLMYSNAIQDMKDGHGFCFIDPHGDVADQLLQHLPRERVDDLIFFDLSNLSYPIAFNPLHADEPDERDVVSNDLVEMFVAMYGHEIFAPRIQDYFRNACFLLMEQPEGGTLVEIMRLFTDAAYLESKLRNVSDPVILSRRNKTYKAMGDREKAEIIPFIQAKFAPFTTGVYVRNVIGQPQSSFNFFDAMQEKKIIICKLAKGLAGEMNAQLIGRMVAMQIKIAALKRAKIEEDDRQPFFLYVDEFQNYVSKSFESILSEARKYRLGLAVAHQYIDQLKQGGLSGELDLSKTIFGNVGTIFSLKVGAPDAEFLEKEFEPEFSRSDLVNMDKFKGIMKMSIDSQQSRPFSFAPTNPYSAPPLNTAEKVEIIKQISALKRGNKRELVEKEVFYRISV